jgi:hypothetical protein
MLAVSAYIFVLATTKMYESPKINSLYSGSLISTIYSPYLYIISTYLCTIHFKNVMLQRRTSQKELKVDIGKEYCLLFLLLLIMFRFW